MSGFLNIGIGGGTGGGAVTWKGTVATAGSLPAVGNSPGDVRVALDTFSLWVWNGSAWILPSESATAWGAITGTLSNQTDLQNALNLKANLASPTFTGTVTVPAVNITGNVNTLLSASKVLITDPSSNLAASSVTTTTLGYLDATSSIQTQLNSKINTSAEGVANGVATLDGGGKVPVAQLPSTVMLYLGAWNASTNSPTLADGTGTNGDTYRASVAGTQNLGSGSQTWGIGDLVIYNGSIWQKAPAADGVSSVNGFTGAVVLTTTNIAEGTNLYFTTARARTSLSVDGGSDPLSYNSGTGVFSMPAASGSQNGYLTSTDWTTFNSKQSTLTLGNLTDVGTDGIVITGGTGAVVGTGTSIAQHVADTTHNGYLSSTDWNTFNGKQAAGAYITALTGDGTAAGPGSSAFTLATVNSNTGSWGSASSVGTFTVNGKGLITAASNTSIQIAESQVTNLVSDLASKANQSLSNLTSPTSINQNLLFNADATFNIGDAGGTARPSNVYVANNVFIGLNSANSVLVSGPSKQVTSTSVSTTNLNYLLNVEPLTTLTLNDNTSSPTNVYSVSASSFSSVQIDYSISRTASGSESGRINLITDGTTAGIDQSFASINGSSGVTFTTTISGGNLLLQYTTTSTGNNASMNYKVQKWLA